MGSRRGWADTLAEAVGRGRRVDPIEPGRGGPAGNARLTAWTGLLVLVLFLVESATLFDVEGLIGLHILVGVLLVPPALLKTATTGWRIVCYYREKRPYRRAGPPPWPLRVLGPLVVLCTAAALGTGLVLIVLGPGAGTVPLVAAAGPVTSPVGLHKAASIAWVLVTGLHAGCRLVPAFRIAGAGREAPRVPGRMPRIVVLTLMLVVMAVAAGVGLGAAGPWEAAVRGGLPGVDLSGAGTG